MTSNISEDAAKAPAASAPGSAMFRHERDGNLQDWPALRAHLREYGLEMDLAIRPRQFSAGFGNLNYLIAIDGKEWVLRRPPAGELPPGANDMQREFTILQNLWKAFPLAPQAIHFSADKAILGAPFLIMEYRPGLVIGGILPASPVLTQEQRYALGKTLVSVLAQLHSVDTDAVGLGGLGRPAGMLSRMIDGWERRAALAAGTAAPEGVIRLAGWLRKNLPEQQPACLLHSDFKLDNVILDPVTLKPRAVIDWDMGTRGDPLVDLATLLSYWTESGDPPAMHQLGQMPTMEQGFHTRREIAELYALKTGTDISALRFYRVLTMLKLTVIFMQLHAQFLRGVPSTDRYRTFGSLAQGLLDFTEEIALGNAN